MHAEHFAAVTTDRRCAFLLMASCAIAIRRTKVCSMMAIYIPRNPNFLSIVGGNRCKELAHASYAKKVKVCLAMPRKENGS
jgi:hypothetical protein